MKVLRKHGLTEETKGNALCLTSTILDLDKEITQLQAQVDNLKAAIEQYDLEYGLLKAENDNWRKHGADISLIKAEAIEEACAKYGYLNEDLNEWVCDEVDLANYAKQLRGES